MRFGGVRPEQGGTGTPVEADLADFSSTAEKALCSAAERKAQDLYRLAVAYNDRLENFAKSTEANEIARRRQQLHVSREIIEVSTPTLDRLIEH